MGKSPVGINKDDSGKIKATVKHDNYNGEPQTKLLRIKRL